MRDVAASAVSAGFVSTTPQFVSNLTVAPTPFGALAVTSVGVERRDKREVGSRTVHYDRPATIVVRRVFKKGRTPRPVTPPSAEIVADQKSQTGVVFATDHFVTLNTTEPDREKFSPVYTLGVPVAYTAGRTHKLYSYVGLLTDTSKDGSGMAQWVFAYENFMRGTAAVRQGLLMDFLYRDQFRRGVLIHTNFERDAVEPTKATFGFTMWVTSHVRDIPDPNPLPEDVSEPVGA